MVTEGFAKLMEGVMIPPDHWKKIQDILNKLYDFLDDVNGEKYKHYGGEAEELLDSIRKDWTDGLVELCNDYLNCLGVVGGVKTNEFVQGDTDTE